MNAMLPAVMGIPSGLPDGAHPEPEIIEGEFSEAPSRGALISQTDSDRHLIELWLGKHASRHTRQNYARHARRFLAFVAKPLAEVRLGDLQAFSASLEHQAPASRANAIAALKSLFTFAQEAGYLRCRPSPSCGPRQSLRQAPPVGSPRSGRLTSPQERISTWSPRAAFATSGRASSASPAPPRPRRRRGSRRSFARASRPCPATRCMASATARSCSSASRGCSGAPSSSAVT